MLLELKQFQHHKTRQKSLHKQLPSEGGGSYHCFSLFSLLQSESVLRTTRALLSCQLPPLRAEGSKKIRVLLHIPNDSSNIPDLSNPRHQKCPDCPLRMNIWAVRFRFFACHGISRYLRTKQGEHLHRRLKSMLDCRSNTAHTKR